MAWDSSRPVPWNRLVREWLIYGAIMAVVFALFFRDRPLAGIAVGLLASGPLYLALGYVLAKFGYQRRSLKQMRDEQSAKASTSDSRGDDDTSTAGPRPKPPPTKRTGGGASSGRPGGARKRRR